MIKFLKNILLFIPCMIGKFFICFFCGALPQYNNNNINDRIESQRLYMTGFKFFLIVNSFLLFLFIFIKLISNNPFFFKILYYKISVFLFSLVINTVLYLLLKKLSNKINIKNIQKKLEKDEKIIISLEPKFFAVAGCILLFSFISAIIMQYFAEITALSLYTVVAIVTFYIFPMIITTFLYLKVMTNKRIIIARFLKSLENLSFSDEKLKDIMEQDKKIGCVPIHLAKEDIFLSDIIMVSEINLRCASGKTLIMNNGLVFLLNSENEIDAISKIEKHLEKYAPSHK